MKTQQANSHMTLSNKKDEMNRILESNPGYLREEIESAKQSLFDISEHELIGQFIRSKAIKIAQKPQMTKYHFYFLSSKKAT